jgi:hypothetical protein
MGNRFGMRILFSSLVIFQLGFHESPSEYIISSPVLLCLSYDDLGYTWPCHLVSELNTHSTFCLFSVESGGN